MCVNMVDFIYQQTASLQLYNATSMCIRVLDTSGQNIYFGARFFMTSLITVIPDCLDTTFEDNCPIFAITAARFVCVLFAFFIYHRVSHALHRVLFLNLRIFININLASI